MAAYRKIPATGNVEVDRVNQAVYEALLAIAPPAAFEALTVTKDYGARGDEGVIHVDSSAGPIRITLPAPSVTMPPLVVKQVNFNTSPRATFGAVTIVAAAAAKTIAGASSYALDASGTGAVTFTSDGQQHWPGSAAGGNPPVNPAPAPVPPFVPPAPPPKPPVPPSPGPLMPSATFSYGDDGIEDSSGAEWVAVALQRTENLTPYAPSLTFTLTGSCSSQSGTATFRVRVGGTAGAVDGQVVATIVQSTAGPTVLSSIPAFFANPGGPQFIKITVQSSTAGQSASMENMVLGIR